MIGSVGPHFCKCVDRFVEKGYNQNYILLGYPHVSLRLESMESNICTIEREFLAGIFHYFGFYTYIVGNSPGEVWPVLLTNLTPECLYSVLCSIGTEIRTA